MTGRSRRAAGHGGKELRQGFTTGSAAAAAAKAALTALLTGVAPSEVDIPLPPGGRLAIPVESALVIEAGATARATVVKDAGDDPDVTHGARISCLVELTPGGTGEVAVEGGRGVGRVTRPGLPVPVGRPAINPAPMAQIGLAAREALAGTVHTGGIRLVIEVEGGEEMAARTLNPRLGITGGISILGTQGVVKPFSLDAWKATIDSGLSVARATGCPTAAFSTGRRGERLLMARRPDLPETAFVQAADFFAYATGRAVELGFAEIVWGCFFGKLAKMAQGLPSTHAHAAPTDFSALAELAGQAGADPATCREVARANTARHALEIVPEDLRERFVARVLARALEAAGGFARDAGVARREGEPARDALPVAVAGGPPNVLPGARLRVGICCFGFEGGVLAEAYTS